MISRIAKASFNGFKTLAQSAFSGSSTRKAHTFTNFAIASMGLLGTASIINAAKSNKKRMQMTKNNRTTI